MSRRFMGDKLLAAPHYYWGCCIICRETSTPQRPLKSCSKCKCISYCSVDHQKFHWKRHKQVCKFLSKNKEERGSFFERFTAVLSENSFLEFRFNSLKMCEKLTGPLNQWEKEMFLFPKVCKVCGVFKENCMIDCTRCYSVTYCSEIHKVQNSIAHSKFCKELFFAMGCDNYECSVSIAVPPIPVQSDINFYPHYRTGDIVSYLTKQAGETYSKVGQTLPDFISELKFRFLTERLSGPMTTIYAGVIAGLTKGRNIGSTQKLTIHFVGSNISEVLGIVKFEYILHRLPKCSFLRMIFIGPELKNEENGQLSDIAKCSECFDLGKMIIYEMINDEYKLYVDSPNFVAPDMIIAFNAGFHQFENLPNLDTWGSSLPYLTAFKGVPLVFTAYTRTEAVKDLCRIKSTAQGRLDLVLSCVPNPYCSKRPVRDFDNDEELFYSNQFISIVRKY